MEVLKRRNNRRSNLNLNIIYGNRNQLGVTHRYQTGPESGTISYCFCSHENGTVRYRIVPISGSLFRTAQFLDLFWNGPLDFFPYPCERNPSPYYFLERTEVERYDIVPVWTQPLPVPLFGTDRSGTVRYRTRVNRALVNNKTDSKKLSCNFHLASFYLVNSFFRQSERESRW